MSVPSVNGCKPCGTLILVEHLTDNEILGTSLKLPGKSAKDIGMQQSYILAIGPALDATKLGFKVGDRVLLQGSYNPVPKLQGDEENGREKGLIEAHAIRGVLQEASAIVVE